MLHLEAFTSTAMGERKLAPMDSHEPWCPRLGAGGETNSQCSLAFISGLWVAWAIEIKRGQVHPKGGLSRDLVPSSMRVAVRTDLNSCWSVLAHEVPAKVPFPSRKRPLSSGQRGQCLILPRGFTRPLVRRTLTSRYNRSFRHIPGIARRLLIIASQCLQNWHSHR